MQRTRPYGRIIYSNLRFNSSEAPRRPGGPRIATEFAGISLETPEPAEPSQTRSKPDIVVRPKRGVDRRASLLQRINVKTPSVQQPAHQAQVTPLPSIVLDVPSRASLPTPTDAAADSQSTPHVPPSPIPEVVVQSVEPLTEVPLTEVAPGLIPSEPFSSGAPEAAAPAISPAPMQVPIQPFPSKTPSSDPPVEAIQQEALAPGSVPAEPFAQNKPPAAVKLIVEPHAPGPVVVEPYAHIEARDSGALSEEELDLLENNKDGSTTVLAQELLLSDKDKEQARLEVEYRRLILAGRREADAHVQFEEELIEHGIQHEIDEDMFIAPPPVVDFEHLDLDELFWTGPRTWAGAEPKIPQLRRLNGSKKGNYSRLVSPVLQDSTAEFETLGAKGFAKGAFSKRPDVPLVHRERAYKLIDQITTGTPSQPPAPTVAAKGKGEAKQKGKVKGQGKAQ